MARCKCVEEPEDLAKQAEESAKAIAAVAEAFTGPLGLSDLKALIQNFNGMVDSVRAAGVRVRVKIDKAKEELVVLVDFPSQPTF